ncbi:MAG: ATP-dependent helicase HrpB [Colwellia sp.]|nr:ATP-dependent helicase HrpB [Colwellia sp.]
MSASPLLPIKAIQSQFCQTITQHNTVILSAPPGAGKSTYLPLWLLALTEFAQQKIYLLQPRRLAVKNIATYLASQLNEQVGDTVGYRLRNDTKVSKHTRLEVITEGVLTQIIQRDVELIGCALVVFDEFHERSLHGDLAFALTREVQQGLREDLKILLMSATLDIDYLSKALPDAQVLSSEGRCFPIEYSYQAPATIQRWRDHAISVIKQQALNHHGSILVFLPGTGDIRFIAQALSEICPNDLLLCPLFGDLNLKQQQQAIKPCLSGKRKLVLATNIAETSLTIEGVNMVIDCGFEKVAIYDNASLMNKLRQQQIAKASAIQRAGRAGRLMAGQCIRLYAKDDFERRPEQSIHDIQQADLLPTLIEVARWGVASLADLPLLELPAKIKEQQAWQELQGLNIVDSQNKLTQHGEQVAKLPCHPRFAHMLIQAKAMNDSTALLGCIVTALLEERDILAKNNGQFDSNLTHRVELLITHWHKPYGAMTNIIKQVTSLLKSLQVNPKQALSSLKTLPTDLTGLLLAYAYPERVAKARQSSAGGGGEYICVNGKGVTLHEHDALVSENFIVVADLMQINNMLRVRLAASIELTQIEQIFTNDFTNGITEKELALFDENSGKIIARKQTKLGAMVLIEKVSNKPLSSALISQMWSDFIRKKGLDILQWQTKDIALKTRWQWLSRYFPDYNLPDISDQTLLKNIAQWFAPFVGEIKTKTKLVKLDLSSILLSQLDYQQQQLLKQAAPSHYIAPTGRSFLITYGQEKSPKVSLPMQEVYGLQKTPQIGINIDISKSTLQHSSPDASPHSSPDASPHSSSHYLSHNSSGIPLVLALLSPAKRPIQITQDLAQFWAGSYKAVQKDMRSQYPKHYWPDDPANAQPTNKTKRHLNNL